VSHQRGPLAVLQLIDIWRWNLTISPRYKRRAGARQCRRHSRRPVTKRFVDARVFQGPDQRRHTRESARDPLSRDERHLSRNGNLPIRV